ncbi:uncharacterized protein LOC130554075 [Triplophysa rosa]|uniref:uncharacterized protein LOC130554075 n=1 Tax=Triplophysa rosa TaxID=992332 RepID=UPI0025462A64|nr:uncharacterized protein LOC130554075 [Triplophysa rosa]
MYYSFEYHAFNITTPTQLSVVVVYRPPGPLHNFIEELDMPLSSFPKDGGPLVVFGDFNIHLDKPYASDFHTLTALFDLTCLATGSTHRSGNQFDFIYTRNFTTDNVKVTPLHISDHFFITFNMLLPTCTTPTPPPVYFRRNLRSLSPSTLSAKVTSSLPSNFESLDADTATNTLCSTLTSCPDNLCPLSSRPTRATPSCSWLSDILREQRSTLRAAERKWRKTKNPADLRDYQSLLSSFSASVTTAKMSFYTTKVSNAPNTLQLFKTFNSLPCPPPPPPTSSLTAEDFAVFFTEKTSSISKPF